MTDPKTPALTEPVAYLTKRGDDIRVVLAKFMSVFEAQNGSNGWEAIPLYTATQLQEALDRVAVLEAALQQMLGPLSIAALEARATTAEAALERMRIALHDAITRPMGVVPRSAEEFYDQNHPFGRLSANPKETKG